MGQSVKDAFGVDMSGITVAALENDAGLREHLFMACIAEMSSRGSVGVLEDTPDAVYACAKGLFGGGGSDSGAIINTVWEKSSPEIHEFLCEVECAAGEFFEDSRLDSVRWLCKFLEYASRRLNIDVLPGYVTLDWFFNLGVFKDWIRLREKCRGHWGCLNSYGFSDDDFELVLLRILWQEDFLFGYKLFGDGFDDNLTTIGLSKLCMGSGVFSDYSVMVGCTRDYVAKREYSLGVRDLVECGPEPWRSAVSEMWDRIVQGVCSVWSWDGFLGMMLQLLYNFRFFVLDRDLFDIEVEGVLKSIVDSPHYCYVPTDVPDGVSIDAPRLYILRAYERGKRDPLLKPHLFVGGDISVFCEALHKYNAYLLQGFCCEGFIMPSPSDSYFGVGGEFRADFDKRRYIQDWSVVNYDASVLKRDVRATVKLEGSPIGIIDSELLTRCGDFPYPLMGHRRIEVDALRTFYPEGVRVWVMKGNDAGLYPLLVCLEHIGLYQILGNYFSMIPLNGMRVDGEYAGFGDIWDIDLGEGDFPLSFSKVQSVVREHGLHRGSYVFRPWFRGAGFESGVYSGVCVRATGGDDIVKRVDPFWSGEDLSGDYLDSFIFTGDMSVFDKYYS